MNIPQKKRERFLMIATIVVGAVALLYQFAFSSMYEQITSTSEELEYQKEIFKQYITQYKRKNIIENAYKEIEIKFPQPRADKKPEQQFTEDIDAMCAKLGFSRRNIEPPKDSLIENVDDYKFITVTVRVEGPLKNVAELLKEFHRNALLIKELTLTSRLDKDIISAVITAARIAKLTPEELKELKKSRSKRRRGERPGSVRRRFHF
ncbi:hypothetical protein J7M23_10465 [Candidatus Sumerlaeota bacterium]|nr:hypothetical protein [Candidatus Sumerlaeota bacterium]